MQVLEINRSGIALSLYKGFVRISEKDGHEDQPLDLLDCILLNSYGAKISNQLMIKLCELNIPLIICGSNSSPIGILSATSQNVYRKPRIDAQLSLSMPLRKRLWQAIVRAKIFNQILLLKQCNKAFQDMEVLGRNVRSGDQENMEAQAARIYWQRLFGTEFRRNPDLPGINSFLNYAYAILRAAFCRQIVAKGLLPELGIHHKNLMNPFCLADDLMEPFRPFADKLILEMKLDENKTLEPKDKRRIISLLDFQIAYRDKTQHIQRCIALYTQDLVDSYVKKKMLLTFPDLPSEWIQTHVDDGDV